jgi:ATP-binding cassette subfamily F protein 3
MGYYAQNQAEELDLNKTVFATIDDIAKGDIRKRVRDLLGAFLFSGEDVEKQVKVLSGGEKARLALCKLLLEPYNFLVLDEPTNHLDIQSKEILKDALANYQGSMVIVSHDRAFLRGLSNKIFEVKNKKIREFVGDIDYYVSQTTQTENDSLKSENPTPKVVKPVVEVKKRPDNEIKQLKNKVNKLEKEIEEIEIEIKNLENLLSMPENATNFNLFNQHSDFTKKLNQLTKEWEQCIENLEG